MPPPPRVGVSRVDAAAGLGSRGARHALTIRGKSAIAGITPLSALQTVFVVLRRNRLGDGEQGCEGCDEERLEQMAHVVFSFANQTPVQSARSGAIASSLLDISPQPGTGKRLDASFAWRVSQQQQSARPGDDDAGARRRPLICGT